MKELIDNFSEKSENYKRFRPVYPDELYEKIMVHVKERNCSWDCGTGNGQVAKSLSTYFDKVYATDMSENQIKNANQHPRIKYKIERAEKTNFESNKFDLITVGQAAHWFDFTAFNKEVKRVSKNNGIICIWGYGVSRINKDINGLIDEFYEGKISPYWNKEIKHIETSYQDIEFDFKEIKPPKGLKISTKWKKEDLIGHLNTCSGVKNYKHKNEGKNPVNELIESINKLWETEEEKQVDFPIFMRIGKIEK